MENIKRKVKKPSIKELEMMIWKAIEKHVWSGKKLISQNWGLGLDWIWNESRECDDPIFTWGNKLIEKQDCRCALSCLINTEKDIRLANKLEYGSEIDKLLCVKLGLTNSNINNIVSGFDGFDNRPTSKYEKLGSRIRAKCIEKKYLTV